MSGLLFPLLFAFVVAVSYMIMSYRQLKNLKRDRMRAFSDIDAQLRLRFHLIPELVKATSHYATSESGLIEQLHQAQVEVSQSRAIRHRIKAEMSLEHAMKGLISAFSTHPELARNQHYQKMIEEIHVIQSHIADESYNFNYITDQYNNSIDSFPENLIAATMGLTELARYPVPAAAQSAQPPAPPQTPVRE